MNTPKMRSLLVYLLPFLHLGACVTLAFRHYDTAWEYLGLIDFPASIIVVAVIYNFDRPLIVFGIVGTVWWYLVSRAAQMVGKWAWAAIQRDKSDQ